MDIVLVHGYNVTSTKTYGVLPQRLKSLGYNIKDVYLSKYVTLDDDLTLSDIIKAFQVALVDLYGSSLEKKKFACITHSTGGLVVRGWIDQYYATRLKALPLSHLIMLAPPSHGSRLAGIGKSRLNRLRSLWGAEPGVKILTALELGSQYQWDLDTAWITKKIHATPNFYPVVITGQWIDKKIYDTIVPATYERGSDGVVRASSANMNIKKFSFVQGENIFEEVMGGIPFLITPQTSHADERYGIMAGVPSKGSHPTLEAIVQVLQVKDRRGYQLLEADFAMKTALLQRKETYYDGTPLDQYSQLVVRIHGDMGEPLSDYAIELLDAEGRGDLFPTGFLPHSQQNPSNPEFFIYYLNYTQISKVIGKQIGVRVHSVTHSPLVNYEVTHFSGDTSAINSFIKPNQTTYLDISLRRRLNKNIFRLTDNLSYQKIKGDASEDWI